MRGLDLTVERGTFFGVFGPDGAGKTTSLRLVLGLAVAGSLTVLGGESRSYETVRLTRPSTGKMLRLCPHP